MLTDVIEPSGTLQRLIVEIQYDRGVVFLDRCGSLTLKLQAIAGDPFLAKVPTMEGGQLENALEKIILQFGTRSLRVEQTAPTTPARVEKLITETWDCLADTLEVRDHVRRFAVRVFNIWPTASIQVARRIVNNAGLVAASSVWSAAFGDPSWASYIAVTAMKTGGHIRRQVDTVEHKIEGALPAGIAEFFPEACIQFDSDYSYGDPTKVFGLKRNQVREFVRSNWDMFQTERLIVGEKLKESWMEDVQ